MNLNLKNINTSIQQNKIGNLYHDIYGNMFLLFNEKYYWINIDNTDNLKLELIEDISLLPKISDHEQKYKKIKHTFNPSSLKGKILGEILEEKHDSEESDIDDEDTYNYVKNLSYHPEEKYYYVDENDNIDDMSDSESLSEKIFEFSKFGDDTVVKPMDRTFESASIYDTFIIDIKNDLNVVVFTLESKEKSSYRLTINTNNIFTLNIVGQSVRFYNICYNEDLAPNLIKM